jgi:hypothetical protein
MCDAIPDSVEFNLARVGDAPDRKESRMRGARFLLPVVLAALLAGCGGAGDAARTITFPVDPRHGSGIAGIAELTRAGPERPRLRVEFADPAPPDVVGAVYRGSCTTIPATPVTRRAGPDGGTLTLRIARPLRTLARSEHAVVLRQNGHVVGCGDIPPGSPTAVESP